jgi:agmatinase
VEKALAPLVEAEVFPLALGGDHSVTLAELRVLAGRQGPLGIRQGPLALIQFDAHGDTWDEYSASATSTARRSSARSRRG